MLVHLVRSHPDCVSNSEVMAITDSAGGFDVAVRDDLSKFGDEDGLVHWRKRDPVDFMHRAAFYAGDNPWSGFKIKSDELVQRKYKPVLEALQADTSIKVLHLNRRNLLERYVSWWMVNKVTGVTMALREEDRPEFQTAYIDPKKAEKDFLAAEERRAMVDRWFAHHDVLDLDYEDLVADPEDASEQICEFLDIELRSLTTRTIKISPHVRNLIENWDELVAYFAGSRFAHLFELETAVPFHQPSGADGRAGEKRFRVPLRIHPAKDRWAPTGSPFHHYLGDLFDLSDLEDSSILAIGDHSDILEAVSDGRCGIGSYVGFDASVDYLRYCRKWLHDPAIDLHHVRADDVLDVAGWPHRELFDPADLVVVRVRALDVASPELEALGRELRARVVEGARLVLAVEASACADAASRQTLMTTFAGFGWRIDEVREPRHSYGHHIVATAT
jgi:hypothetical protein